MTRLIGFALLFLIATSAAAQVQESITVDVIEIPVHVTRRGKAVTGLTRDVFELYVNGKLQPFEYFDVIDARRPDTAMPEAETPTETQLQRRSLTVLLFDTAATSHPYLVRASQAVQKFVSEAPAHETFAVARLDADGVQFLVPFTDDRAAILRACRTLRPSRAGDALGLATLQSERTAFGVTDAAPAAMLGLEDAALDNIETSLSASGVTAETIGAAAAFHQRIVGQLRTDSEARAAKHLGEVAERLAPLTGVKHVILFSEGSRRATDPRTAAQMHQKFQAAGVILDAVELDTLRVQGQVDAERRVDKSLFAPPYSDMPEDRSEPLYTLALGTGGTVTKNYDVLDGLRILREIQGVTYILGFRPPQTGKTQNDVTVKLKKQPFGTTVTYRKGYTTTTPVNRNEGLFLADVMLNNIPQRGVTVNLNVAPVKSGAQVMVSIPGQELLARQTGAPTTDVDVFLYVFNEQDVVAAWAYWRLNIDLEKGREFLSSNAYRIQRLFPLGPGKFSAKALLRFPNSDITGFQRADFQVRGETSGGMNVPSTGR